MLLEFVYLKEWKTKKTILKELKEQGYTMDERTWRTFVEKHNKRYYQGLEQEYIVHSAKGYKLTKDTREINAALEDYKKRALNMLKKVSEGKKGMQNRMNSSFDEVEI